MIWDWCFLNYSKNFSYILEQYNKAIQCNLSLLSIAGRPGRPSINIPPEVLEDLRGIGFTWVKTARVFKVSRWTIMRRVRLFDLEHLSLQYHYWWKKLTALFVISCQQVVLGAPEPDRTLRSVSEALFSRSAAFLSFSSSSFIAKEIDAHSYIAP